MTPKSAHNAARARECVEAEPRDRADEWEHPDVLAYVQAAMGAVPHELQDTDEGVANA